MKKALTVVLLASAVASTAAAETELSFYLGAQSAPHSRLQGSHPAIGPINELIGWQGRPFSPPPYYGMRATFWRSDKWGWGLELAHAKLYAPDGEMAAAGFDRLEFSDGHNIFTLNGYRRWKNVNGSKFTPFVGAGIGVAVPHVDARPIGGDHTYGYQFTGPAVRLAAGVSYDINTRWAAFGEYQMTYSDNDVTLDGGGSMSSAMITNALNFGISYKF